MGALPGLGLLILTASAKPLLSLTAMAAEPSCLLWAGEAMFYGEEEGRGGGRGEEGAKEWGADMCVKRGNEHTCAVPFLDSKE